MNQVQLVGNLARDPEYRTLQSGVTCCQFTVACQRKFKNQQTGQYEADFINCVAWRERADFVHRYFIKGNKIGLTGSIQTRSYDGQDGQKRYVTEVVVENVEFVAPRSDGGGNGQSAPPPAQPAPQRSEQQRMDYSGGQGEFVEVDDDDLPF